MKTLEMQLRSWELRPPSARVKRELFSTRRAGPDQSSWSFQWLTPVAACLVFAAMMLHQNYQGSGGMIRSEPALTLVLSNQSPRIQTENSVTPATSNAARSRFEWTNHSAFTSSVTSFLPGKEN
jgi:hypothetical protein